MRGRAPGRMSLAPLLVLLLVSGATSLGYEVLWARMLGTRFGASIVGVAIAVSAFLLGLGLGALLAARLRPTPARALRALALIEGAVALSALLLAPLWQASGAWFDALAPLLGAASWRVLEGACALVVLSIPATLLGAGFPLALHAARDCDRPLAAVYAANTLGAAIGALAALFLLAQLGSILSLRVVAAAGLLVATGAWALARLARSTPADDPLGPVDSVQASSRRGQIAAYAVVGAAAIGLEISWTRLFGVVLLRTEYVLAIVLAVFLAGTALGSALARRRSGCGVPAPLAVLACAFSLLGLALLPALGAWAESARFDSLASALAAQAFALALFTLPVTAVLGSWLPLLARTQAAGDAALLYGANCLGGALGAVATVTLLIPWLGASGSVCLSAIALMTVGLFAQGGGGNLPLRDRLLRVAALGAAALACAWVGPFPEPERMLPGALAGARELARYEDALTLQHVVEMPDGRRLLLTDLQHMDASTDPAAIAVQEDQVRFALLLHPAPRRLLLLGLGTGISAAGSLPWPGLDRTAVEISPGAIAAAGTWFAEANHGVAKESAAASTGASAGSMRLVRDDARHFLAADQGSWDVIVGDLFHPDLAGTGSLLSVEHFARARARLAKGGVFVQWLALNQFDVLSAATVLRSFQAVFPDARLYLDAMHLALVGGGGPADALSMRANLARLGAPGAGAATGDEGPMTWLGRFLGPVHVVPGPLQREAAPVIEFALPRLHHGDAFALPAVLGGLMHARPPVEQAARLLGVAADDRDFAGAFAGTGLMARSWLASIAGDARGARELLALSQQANPADRWVRWAVADGAHPDALP
jgi:spermidine synthase